jgi:glycosyltransferase involved in cell wall biosynthesis
MAKMRRPAVSVVIPCFNCARFVGECLDSVLAQDMRDFEIVAVNDGSTDETLEILKRFTSHPGVRVVELNHSHGGPSKARNAGIAASTGTVVMVLDADDLLRPHALASIVQFALRAPHVGLMFFNSSLVDFETGQDRGRALTEYESFWRLSRTPIGENMYVVDDAGTYRRLVLTNFIKTSGTAIPRGVLEDVGPFDERLTNADDWHMWLRIARRYQIGLIDSPEVVYHSFRSGSISSRGRKLIPNRILVAEEQLQFASDPATISAVRSVLAEKHRDLAWALRIEGRQSTARTHYRRSLRYTVSQTAMRGWLLTWLPSRLHKLLRSMASRSTSGGTESPRTMPRRPSPESFVRNG